MAMTRREFLVNSLAVGTMSLVSHLNPARRLRGGPSESDVLAFTHVTVIDATGRPALPEQTVLVKGDRIAAIEKFGKLKLPGSAKVIDARGKYVIPGLWDMHVHARGTPAVLSGSGRESVRPPDLMGILILGHSGYTRQYERDGLEQNTWVAGVCSLPTRNR